MKSHKHHPIIPMSRLWKKERIWENTTKYYCISCGKQIRLRDPRRIKVVERTLEWFSFLWFFLSLIILYLCNADWSYFAIFAFWACPPLVAAISGVYLFPRYLYEWEVCNRGDSSVID